MSKEQNERLGAVLVQAREAAGLTIDLAAGLVGIPAKALEGFEKRPSSAPLTVLVGIAAAYKIDPIVFVSAFNEFGRLS